MKKTKYFDALKELEKMAKEFTKKTGYILVGVYVEKVYMKGEMVDIVRIGKVDVIKQKVKEEDKVEETSKKEV